MIRIVERGLYRLIETKHQTKILILDGEKTYAWIYAEGIGEILIASNKVHKADTVLGVGNYRLYNVKNEPKFTDQIHLELCVGPGIWQGYLLPTGLPEKTNTKNRIIPTKEIISTSNEEACPPVCVCQTL